MADIRKKTRFLKETSDRSGFDNWSYDGKTFNKRWESVRQDGSKIAPEEYDVPPPSNIPLGGADISGTPRTNSLTTDVPSISEQTILYITAAGGISINDEPWILISGSSQAVTLTADPQVSAGRAQQILGIECVGSSVTLVNSSGLALHAGRRFLMDSGAIVVLMYDGTDNLWRETSRSHRLKSLGEL